MILDCGRGQGKRSNTRGFKGYRLERADIKAELKMDLIILLAENGDPPVERDEVYKELFEQAENCKKYQGA